MQTRVESSTFVGSRRNVGDCRRISREKKRRRRRILHQKTTEIIDKKTSVGGISDELMASLMTPFLRHYIPFIDFRVRHAWSSWCAGQLVCKSGSTFRQIKVNLYVN